MPKMILKQEVDATPELVIASLLKHVSATADSQFPFPATSLILLTPDVLAAVGGIPDMPSLVMMTGKGSPLGVVAICKTDGDITVAYVAPAQVVGFWTTAPAPANDQGSDQTTSA